MTPGDIRNSTRNAAQGIMAEGEYCDCDRCVMVRALADVVEAASQARGWMRHTPDCIDSAQRSEIPMENPCICGMSNCKTELTTNLARVAALKP